MGRQSKSGSKSKKKARTPPRQPRTPWRDDVPLDETTAAIIQQERETLRAELGRAPEGDEPIFFDPNKQKTEQQTRPKAATPRIEMNPERLRTLAESKLRANMRLRHDLKFSPRPVADIDAMFHRAHDEVSAVVDCTQCAQCCATLGPVLDDDDVERLASRLDLTPEQVRARYLRVDVDDGSLVFAAQPCPFLAERRCSVYEDRPEACRSYPHLHRDEMPSRLLSVIDNSMTCPIVYEVLERVRGEVKRHGKRGT